MKEKIIVEGQEFDLVTKQGLADKKGKFIIPTEYDRIIKVNPYVFAAIKDRQRSGVATFEGLVDNGNIRFNGMINSWKSSNYRERITALEIDFYTIRGKLRLDKKVLAYYYSVANGLLVLLDENLKWCIGVIDYQSQEIQISYNPKSVYVDSAKQEVVISERDEDIDRVKETEDGKLIIEKNGLYEFIYNGGSSRYGQLKYKEIEPYKKGFVAILDNNKRGFIDYDGNVILKCIWDDIIPKDNYIEVSINEAHESGESRGIFSYKGKIIVPFDYKRICAIEVLSKTLYFAETKEKDGDSWIEIYSDQGFISAQHRSSIQMAEDGLLIYSLEKSYGVSQYCIDKNDFINILPCIYDAIEFVFMNNQSYLEVKKGNKSAFFDKAGKQLCRFRKVPILHEGFLLSNTFNFISLP